MLRTETADEPAYVFGGDPMFLAMGIKKTFFARPVFSRDTHVFNLLGDGEILVGGGPLLGRVIEWSFRILVGFNWTGE